MLGPSATGNEKLLLSFFDDDDDFQRGFVGLVDHFRFRKPLESSHS